MRITQYFIRFFKSNQGAGILLLFCIIFSLLLTNSQFGNSFQKLLNHPLGILSVSHWINDGLMSVFFLLVGLEIKREFLDGELSNFKNASLPILAAIGGMIVPSIIFFSFNNGTPYATGWAIPMATDIAFSLAVLSLIPNVPSSIRIFLAALAIVDDLGAILVIALFYSGDIHWIYLIYALGIIILLGIFNFFNIRNLTFYVIPGIFLWYFIHHSGIHSTIAGVLLAFMIPATVPQTDESPLEWLEEKLHFPVNYLIMPVFAIANTNILFKAGMVDHLGTTLGLGIIVGLCLGKTIGITLFSFVGIKTNLSQLPEKAKWSQMIGAGFLAGIGFTMSIFIALLSFQDTDIQNEAKFSILVASFLSGILGYIILKKQNSINKII